MTLFFTLSFTSFLFSEELKSSIATYPEIPYYLKQLQQTTLEGERIKYNKIIHEAVVHAELSDPRIVKKMEPIIQKIQIAADSGLDRAFLDGQSMWLHSAIEFFEREKGRKAILVPLSDWMENQTVALNGLNISTYPDKILLHDGEKTKTVVESANIYEAVISPDGRLVAFGRRTDEESRAEIWVVNLKSLKRKKIATVPSIRTLVFSLKGDKIFLQEEPAAPKTDTILYSVSSSGGKPRIIGKIRLLQTIVGKGAYKGHLIVYKKVVHHLGIAEQECAFVIRENGDEIGKIKDVPCL